MALRREPMSSCGLAAGCRKAVFREDATELAERRVSSHSEISQYAAGAADLVTDTTLDELAAPLLCNLFATVKTTAVRPPYVKVHFALLPGCARGPGGRPRCWRAATAHARHLTVSAADKIDFRHRLSSRILVLRRALFSAGRCGRPSAASIYRKGRRLSRAKSFFFNNLSDKIRSQTFRRKFAIHEQVFSGIMANTLFIGICGCPSGPVQHC
jgi:hypothetical protein